ncbi:MAG: hypothetical protein KAH30_00645 [Caldisericia bacterium]|nr:hypothetical protein [Caldisericia bacterium]
MNNKSGCSLLIMVIFSGIMALSMLYTGWLHESNVWIGFGIFQVLVTVAGIYGIIKNKMKENSNPKDSNDIEETK